MSKKCETCGSAFEPRRKSSKYCCRRCLWDANAKRQPHNWGIGSGWTDKRGYRWIYVTENGRRRAKREHRHVMEMHIGRKLAPEELVHHINGDTSDNRIENLEIQEWGAHTAHHHDQARHTEYAKRTQSVMAMYREELKRIGTLNSELLEALERVTRGRHIHTSIGSPDGGETCGKCGESYRSSIHYAHGESHSDDLEKARAIIAKARGEKA